MSATERETGEPNALAGRVVARDRSAEERCGLFLRDPSHDPLHLPRIRKPAHPELRKHEIAVDPDVEDPATALDQARLEVEFSLQLGRQPGSPRQVVSLDAVFDSDIHLRPPGFAIPKRIDYSCQESPAP